ncbi:hypothetical protein D3C80_1235720 [compost metagenome]
MAKSLLTVSTLLKLLALSKSGTPGVVARVKDLEPPGPTLLMGWPVRSWLAPSTFRRKDRVSLAR